MRTSTSPTTVRSRSFDLLWPSSGQKIASWVPRCRQDDDHEPDQPLYDIADGKIRYDGININKIHAGSRRLSASSAGVKLFTGTVME